MNFLVVDDSAEDIALLRSALKPVAPVEITPIENGHTALQLLSGQRSLSYDLIVIDWRLPGVTGDQLAKAFLTHPAVNPLTPVVILSAALPPPISEGLHRCGAFVLEKPSDLDGYDKLAVGLCDLAKRSRNGSLLWART
jgi:CheY-like chemotaxis protein